MQNTKISFSVLPSVLEVKINSVIDDVDDLPNNDDEVEEVRLVGRPCRRSPGGSEILRDVGDRREFVIDEVLQRGLTRKQCCQLVFGTLCKIIGNSYQWCITN